MQTPSNTADEINKEEEWSEENLLKNWNKFSKKLEQEQKVNLHTMFERYLPQKNKNEIILNVVSLSEQAEITEIKTDLLFFLRNKLNNSYIKLSINVIQSKEEKNMLYTKDEKYKYFLEKNHDIELLKNKLNLTIT